MELNTGDLIDQKYRIVRLLGEGGMGAVYEGENTRIHRRVAIKVLHAGVASNADVVARFEREAQAAGRIGSEHIVEVLDLGQLADGDRYMVMEFMDGEALSDRIQRAGRLTPEQVHPIAMQMLDGLQAAHTAGIIHRDLKPDNIYLVKSKKGHSDFAKLLDFGISKFNTMGGEFSMTRTGAVMGTPYYMAPEQAKGAKDIDFRVDIYAAGVILYEAVSGQVPFNADTFNELIFKIVLEAPPPIEQVVPGIDPAFAAIISKAMAREPAERFQTCQEFSEALAAWGQGRQLGAAAPGTLAGAPAVTGVDRGTAGAWSNTQADAAAVPGLNKSKTGLFVALGAAALLLVGGGVVTALKFAGDSEKAAAAAAQAEQDRLDAERKTNEELQRLEAEKKKAQAARAEAEARAESEKAKADEQKEELEAAKKKVAAAAEQADKPAPKPVLRPRAPAKPAPPKPKTSTGSRQIRTSL